MRRYSGLLTQCLQPQATALSSEGTSIVQGQRLFCLCILCMTHWERLIWQGVVGNGLVRVQALNASIVLVRECVTVRVAALLVGATSLLYLLLGRH